jgi:hypothetical protein
MRACISSAFRNFKTTVTEAGALPSTLDAGPRSTGAGLVALSGNAAITAVTKAIDRNVVVNKANPSLVFILLSSQKGKYAPIVVLG